MPAVSQADLERWKAFGGSYQESNGRKTYTAPSGKKFKSWKEAEQLMKQDSEMENAGENPGAQKGSSAVTKKRSRPAASDSEGKDAENTQTGMDAAEDTKKDGSGTKSRKRAATEGKNYNEEENRTRFKSEKVHTVVDSFCKTEEEALEGTGGSGAQPSRPQRRLKLFAVVTSEDDMMQLQQVGQANSEELFMQGAVYPSSGKALKADGRRLAQRFGAIKHWKATYRGNEPEVIVSTELADYTIMTCAPEFREHFNDVREQVTVCHCIVQTMKGKDAKDAEELSLESVMAAVSRAKAVTGYATVREAVLLNGAFILAQVPAMQAELGSALNLDKSTFISELRAELRQGPPKTMLQQQSIGIQFNEKAAGGAGSSKDVDMSDIPTEDCDTQYARRVQAKMDAAKYLQAQRGGAKVQKQGTAYIKISEEEIADDYPLPMQYEPQEAEMDELVVNGDDEIMLDVDPECLPTMVIDNFAVYNADGFMSTLELLPMWQHVDPDVDLFGSGIISQLDEDDSEWCTGHALNNLTARDLDLESRANCAGTSGASTSAAAGCSGEAEAQQPQGMNVCLSQIKEWHLEVAADMVFIVVRTDCAWYKVRSVLPAYEGWFRPILKVCSLAAHLLSMIANATRSSKISLQDVVNSVSALKVEDSPSIYISSKKEKVERFMLVHGQIILNQFKNYPVKAIQQCAFVSALQTRMSERKHSKLFMSKRKFTANMRIAKKVNPMRNRDPKPKPKPMTATATTLVKAIWADYFCAGAAKAENAGDKARPVEDDENAEDEADGNAEAEVEQALAEDTVKASQLPEKAKDKAVQARKQRTKALPFKMQAKIEDSKIRAMDGQTSYKQIRIGDTLYELGDVVILEGEDEEEEEGDDSEMQETIPGFAMLQYIGEDEDGDVDLQMRMMQHGKVTVLGDTASDHELFMAACEPVMFKPEDIRMKCDAERLKVPHGPLQARDEANAKIQDLLKDNAGKAIEERKLLYRMQYRPKEGMFCKMPADLELGNFIPAPVNLDKVLDESQRFAYKGGNYGVGCFVYLLPEQVKTAPKRKPAVKDDEQEDDDDEEEDNKLKDHKPNNVSSKKKASGKAPKRSLTAAKDGPENSSKKANKNTDSDVDQVHENLQDKYYMHKYTARDLNNGGKGDLEGLVPYTIAQILEVETKMETSQGSKVKKVTNMKLKLFARPEDVDPETAYKSNMWTLYATNTEVEDIDVDRLRGRCHVALNDDVKPGAQEMTGQQLDVFVCEHTLVKNSLTPKPKSLKVKGDVSDDIKLKSISDEKKSTSVALRTLDIFSGCGGLSEGMHQAGAAVTEWAIEYWTPAAEAFKENNKDAFVYNGNCNVLLHRAMVKAGMEAQCDACDECVEQSGQFDDGEAEEIPLPGEVEFICGGPPCQGYSGMNRFNQGNWSMVQNSMVMSYLSYADFYRPRYWLLENVRNFVSHNKSHTFRLTLRTLLDMGYQVRFGVLNAGNFGVSQSRKRTFIWAAAPQEELPDWPRSLTVFKSPQLCIKLPDGESYTAVSDGKHARLRAVTVRDTIGDMPAVENGENNGKRQYSSKPVSHFQQQIRGEETELKDHICKTMNELNMRRCELVPKNVPGADWRSLVLHVEKHPEDALFNDQKVVPWCLPNTADRHNGWRGLFGRLNWEGHFPTSVTDPNPMGKVGQVFHPEQDRIVSVRECARAQGFPDRFLFSGTVHDRHKEVGNAVPPPLAAALGRQLKKKLLKKAECLA